MSLGDVLHEQRLAEFDEECKRLADLLDVFVEERADLTKKVGEAASPGHHRASHGELDSRCEE